MNAIKIIRIVALALAVIAAFVAIPYVALAFIVVQCGSALAFEYVQNSTDSSCEVGRGEGNRDISLPVCLPPRRVNAHPSH